MRSTLALLMVLAGAVAPAAAQGTKAPAKKDSAKAPVQAPAAKVDTKQSLAGASAKPDTKQATKGAPVTPPATKGGAAAPNTKAPVAAPVAAPAAQAPPTIMREVFSYQTEGRRDPFATLLTSSDLRPTIADLRLTGVLYDENGSNSIAVMRDIGTNALYRVTTGQTLGRMKVALIKRKVVIFSIEAFGLNRQDSLVLGDTTKVRAK